MDASQTAAVEGNGGNGGNGMSTTQTNDTMAPAPAADDSVQILNQLINSTQKTFGLNHQLYLTVSSFNSAFQMPLLQRMYPSVNPFNAIFLWHHIFHFQCPMVCVYLDGFLLFQQCPCYGA